MNRAQLLVRLAAKDGELDKIDPALLTDENLFRRHGKAGLFAILPEKDGPLQDAAAHGQLSFLPPDARKVEAMLFCGMNRETYEWVCNDAFYTAAMAGTLDKIPQDKQFKESLVKWKTYVEGSLNKAATALRGSRTAVKPIDAPTARARINAVRQWWEAVYDARPKSRLLPDIPSVPMRLQSNMSSGTRGRGKGGL